MHPCRALLPPSPQQPLLQGLDLLRLLVQNRIAEFHTELELISPEVSAERTVLFHTGAQVAEGVAFT